MWSMAANPGAMDTDGPDGDATWSFGMLLGPDDLPDPGWAVVEERHWPTGQLDPSSQKSQRALGAGCITAWRSLGRTEPALSAWVEVVPYATPDDARLSLHQVPRFFVSTAADGESIVEERTVGDQPVPGVDAAWVFEKTTSGPQGPTRARYVGGAIGRVLFLTCFSSPAEHWAWADVLDLAARQAERVRRTPGTAPPG
jgi:hypothetical protein